MAEGLKVPKIGERKRPELPQRARISWTDVPMERQKFLAERNKKRPKKSPEKVAFGPREDEAHQKRVEILEESPAMQVLLEIIRGTPEILREVQAVVDRGDEFLRETNPGERHRDLAPLFAGIALNDRARDLLNRAIDRAMAAQSLHHWERIKSGENYIHEFKFGGGTQAGIYNAERQMFLPEDSGLTVDVNKGMGGTFSFGQEAVHGLNSRNRPEIPGLPNDPGSGNALNTTGRGTSSEAHFSGQAYANQSEFGLASRINLLLTSNMMSGVRVEKVYLNPEWRPGFKGVGKYLARVHHEEIDDSATVSFDRGVALMGPGRERVAVDMNDPETRAIVEESLELSRQGKKPRYFNARTYLQYFGNAENWSPLEGIESAAVAGAGDTGRIMVGSLLGYEQDLRKSSAVLDRVEEVVWYGQEARSKEEFAEQERLRYIQLGLEFPRDFDEQYASRIMPVDVRTTRLRKAENGNLIVIDEEGGETEVSHFFDASGIEDNLEEVFAPLFEEEILDRDEMLEEAERIFSTRGTVLSFNSSKGPRTSVKVIRYRSKGLRTTIDLEETSKSGAVTASTVEGSDDSVFATLRERYLTGRSGASKVTFQASGLIKTPEYDELTRDGVAVGERLVGHDIVISGPAAKLPLTKAEYANRGPLFRKVLELIGENTVAVFRWGDLVRRLARMNAYADQDFDFSEQTVTAEPEKVVIRNIPENDAVTFSGLSVSVLQKVAEKGFPEGQNDVDHLRYAVGEACYGYRFPTSIGGLITLNITRVGTESSGRIKFNVSIEPDLPSAQEMTTLLGSLTSSSIFQQLICAYTQPEVSPTGAIIIGIPIREGKAKADRVRWEPLD